MLNLCQMWNSIGTAADHAMRSTYGPPLYLALKVVPESCVVGFDTSTVVRRRLQSPKVQPLLGLVVLTQAKVCTDTLLHSVSSSTA